MIFVTVGTQLPFDRLVRTVDEWAKRNGRTDVVAQIGKARCVPIAMESYAFLDAARFQTLFEAAEIVVAHAGMGTIISALKSGKPLLVMPRQARYGEQRNDHQMATALSFRQLGYINTAMDERELVRELDNPARIACGPRIGDFASERLVRAVREIVFYGKEKS
jgi:UDP-N-acetylglucosamine transferase subunit ALG13